MPGASHSRAQETQGQAGYGPGNAGDARGERRKSNFRPSGWTHGPSRRGISAVDQIKDPEKTLVLERLKAGGEEDDRG